MRILAKYGEKAQTEVAEAIEKYKAGKLKSGRAKLPVKSMKQAVAIGLSKAREEGAKMPPYPKKKD